MNRVSTFGIYLIIISALQMGFYTYLTFADLSDEERWNYYLLDRRNDLTLVTGFFKGPPEEEEAVDPSTIFSAPKVDYPTAVNWLTAVWVLLLGLSFLLGWVPLKTYIISEILLFLPAILFWLFVFLMQLAHGESRFFASNLYYLIPSIFLSVIPLIWAAVLNGIRRYDQITTISGDKA